MKFLHKNTGWNYESPILSDILYVKEEYRTALENVLEPYLSYYVVNNLGDALQAVHLLDDNKKGKANFFMLDKIQNYDLQDSGDSGGNSEHKFEGAIPALSVIDVEERYRKLAEHLLGNVYIADSEEALEINKQSG